MLWNGEPVNNYQQIEVVNSLHGALDLQCIGHYPSNVTDFQWISEESGRIPVVLQEDMGDDYITVSYTYNWANITINNLIRPYRGTLRCTAPASKRQITIFVTESKSIVFS